MKELNEKQIKVLNLIAEGSPGPFDGRIVRALMSRGFVEPSVRLTQEGQGFLFANVPGGEAEVDATTEGGATDAGDADTVEAQNGIDLALAA